MIQGLLPTTPNRLPNPWLYGLEGLASLEAAFGTDNSGLNPSGPTVLSTCGGDLVGCPVTGPVSSTPWGTLPCDPALVNQGLTCNVDQNGNVTYTDQSGNTFPASAFKGTAGPQPVAGGGGSQPGNSVPVGVSPTGTGTGTSGTGTGSAAGGPPKPKPANWGLIALLVVGTLVAVKVMA